MKLARRRCLHAGAAAALAVALPRAGWAAAAQPGDTLVWPPLRLLDGTLWAPASWQDRAAVVVFWATWCPFCEHHNAHVDKLHLAVAGQPLRVLGVAIDGDATSVGRYMARRGYTFPVTLDVEPLRARLTARRGVPTTCTIDRQGRFKQAIPGEMFEADVLELAALAGKG